MKRNTPHARAEYSAEFVAKACLELCVADSDVGRAVELIAAESRTGHVGDGKVFISDVEDVIRIRMGESGGAAL